MYSNPHAAMPPPQARSVAPETFLLDHDAQQSLPPDSIVALQQVDNRMYLSTSPPFFCSPPQCAHASSPPYLPALPALPALSGTAHWSRRHPAWQPQLAQPSLQPTSQPTKANPAQSSTSSYPRPSTGNPISTSGDFFCRPASTFRACYGECIPPVPAVRAR